MSISDTELALHNNITNYHCYCSNSFGTYGRTRRTVRNYPYQCRNFLEYCGESEEDDDTSVLVVYIAGRSSMHTRTIVNRQTADHTLTR